MGSSDFFHRKSLLPEAALAKLRSPAQPEVRLSGRPTAKPLQKSNPQAAPKESGNAVSPEIFERPTVVPDEPFDQHARALMESLDSDADEEDGLPGRRGHEIALSVAPPYSDEEGADPLEFVDRLRSDPSIRLEPSAAQAVRRASPPARPPEANEPSSASVSDLYAVGDFSGALAEAEQRLRQNANDPLALAYRKRCQDMLTKMWTARLGHLGRRVRVAISADQLRWLSVDHKAGFVLSLIDGSSTLDEILDMSGMPQLDALRILTELLERGVIEVVR